ncbi:MAG: alpha/beta fold hydrolase [Myxococcales bacterium]|nr:alpha/beta fold hydrolase [Myxococcales bacterium]MCB9523564.1 alpha/beta fold hydrolase [Myxococcales bacterium]
MIGLALGALAGAHGLLVGGGAVALALPNPWLRLTRARGTPGDDGVPFQAVCLADGCAAWITAPIRPTGVVICHGRSRSKAWERPLIKALAAAHTVLAFDFPGHGDNRYAPTTLGDREAASVNHAVDALVAHGVERVVLYGCSMGGAAALISQGRAPHPAVRGVITDGAFAAFSEVVDHAGRALPGYVRRSALGLTGRLNGYDPWAVRPIDGVASIPVPVRLLHGDADTLVTPDAADRMAAAGGATVRAQRYAGGHDEPANPAMIAAVQAFAAEVL